MSAGLVANKADDYSDLTAWNVGAVALGSSYSGAAPMLQQDVSNLVTIPDVIVDRDTVRLWTHSANQSALRYQQQPTDVTGRANLRSAHSRTVGADPTVLDILRKQRERDTAIFSARANARPIYRARFVTLQEWEGYVVAIDRDAEEFTARLIDVTAGDTIEREEAVFFISDIKDDDQKLLKEGAVFRWAIGYNIGKGGMKSRGIQLAFRRLPMHTEADIKRSRERARLLAARLKWDE